MGAHLMPQAEGGISSVRLPLGPWLVKHGIAAIIIANVAIATVSIPVLVIHRNGYVIYLVGHSEALGSGVMYGH